MHRVFANKLQKVGSGFGWSSGVGRIGRFVHCGGWVGRCGRCGRIGWLGWLGWLKIEIREIRIACPTPVVDESPWTQYLNLAMGILVPGRPA